MSPSLHSEAWFDEDVRAILDAPFPCCLTSLDPGGDPRSVVIWCSRRDDLVTVNGGEGAYWFRNVRRDPRVSLVVVDTQDILRYVAMRGRVVDVCEDVGFAHMNRQARLYDKTERYEWESPLDVKRFVVTIEPRSVRLYAATPPSAVRAAQQAYAERAGDE